MSQAYTSTPDPIRTDLLLQLFPSGLAHYTATYLHPSSPFVVGDSIDIYSDTGFSGGVKVWPMPTQEPSSVPGLRQYNVSAYGRWKNSATVHKKIVTGTLYAWYSVLPLEGRSYYNQVELPILYTQIYISKVVTGGEGLPSAEASIDFFSQTGQSLLTQKNQFSFNGVNFPSKQDAVDKAIQEGGNPELVQDTSYISMGRKISDLFPGVGISPRFYSGKFENEEPTHNQVIVGVNENNFGDFKEIEIVKSSLVNQGSITANLIYNFGHFTEIEIP